MLGLPCNTSCTSSYLAPSRVSLLLWAAIAAVALCCATQLYGWLHRVCHPEELERRAQERYEVLEDIKLEAEERRETERRARLQAQREGWAGERRGADGLKEATPLSIREWALKQRTEKRQALQRRGVDMQRGGVLAMVFGHRDEAKAACARGSDRSPSPPPTGPTPCASPCASPSAPPSWAPPPLSRDGSRDSNHSFYENSGAGPADLREAWRDDAVYGGDTPRGARGNPDPPPPFEP